MHLQLGDENWLMVLAEAGDAFRCRVREDYQVARFDFLNLPVGMTEWPQT